MEKHSLLGRYFLSLSKAEVSIILLYQYNLYLRTNAPINGLPQDGGAGQPTGIRLRKAHVGGDFDIHKGPQGGKFDSAAILKSGENLGMSDWSAILENTQKSFVRVSRVQGWLKER